MQEEQARDLAAVFDEHLRDEFELHDAAATMETMSAKPHLYHVPTMAGGNGRDEIFRFYRDHFVTKWPADTSATRVSRTIGEDQLVDELIMTFTHDVVMDALLPGVAPSGKPVSLPVVVVVKFHDGKVAARAYLLGSSVATRPSRPIGSVDAAGYGCGAGAKPPERCLRDQRTSPLGISPAIGSRAHEGAPSLSPDTKTKWRTLPFTVDAVMTLIEHRCCRLPVASLLRRRPYDLSTAKSTIFKVTAITFAKA